MPVANVSQTLNKIVCTDGKWYVKSEDGSKSLGGPYDTEKQAKERLRQVEYFKHNSLQTVNRNIKPVVRHDTLEGVDYLVVPMVMLTEGVHAGSNGPLYYPPDELMKTPVVWNHKPIVVYHPTMGGNAISACDPDVINTHKVGLIMGATYVDGKLKGEAWLREDRLREVDSRVLEAINKGTMVEVSTGLFTDNDAEEGEWKGEKYVAIARNYRPDHLAILPDQKGACSIEDGAGLLRNSSGAPLPFGQVYHILERAASLLRNELSHNDLAQKLQALLPIKTAKAGMPPANCWVNDVYDEFFIYSDGPKYFRQGYKRDGDNVSLQGAPQEVFRSTSYKTADGTVLSNAQKEVDMDKKKIVDLLISNADTPWEEEDREHLMNLSEDRLSKLMQVNAFPAPKDLSDTEKAKWDEMDEAQRAAWLKTRKPPTKNDEPVTPEPEEKEGDEEPETTESYIAKAPAGVRAVLEDGLAAHNAEKTKLIAGITANKACKFSREQLAQKPIGELRMLAELAIPKKGPTANYSGLGDAPEVTNSAEEPLVVPAMTFGK